jgi:hypothetical protein
MKNLERFRTIQEIECEFYVFICVSALSRFHTQEITPENLFLDTTIYLFRVIYEYFKAIEYRLYFTFILTTCIACKIYCQLSLTIIFHNRILSNIG